MTNEKETNYVVVKVSKPAEARRCDGMGGGQPDM
tara:strand:- start:184 stop:285 length:102 start_codon:yes stop_codon:yes gene_type:complete